MVRGRIRLTAHGAHARHQIHGALAVTTAHAHTRHGEHAPSRLAAPTKSARTARVFTPALPATTQVRLATAHATAAHATCAHTHTLAPELPEVFPVRVLAAQHAVRGLVMPYCKSATVPEPSMLTAQFVQKNAVQVANLSNTSATRRANTIRVLPY